MNKILFYNPDFSQNRMFDPAGRDNANEPFIRLKEKLEALGYAVKTIDDEPLTDCSLIFFMVAPLLITYDGLKGKVRWLKHKLMGKPAFRDFYRECADLGLQDKMVLVLWENKAVRPQDHHPLVLEKFKRILTWDDTLVDNQKYFKFLHPYPEHAPLRPTPPFAQKKLLVNISINKRSSYPSELYSARLQSVRYFNDNYPQDFDMFGIGWNQPATKRERMFPWLMPKFACYRGPVKNKLDVLPNYKFSLCYENIRGEQGYVSEKIFDCFRAGVVPIYWGSDNVADYVDAEAFIDRRQFASDKALAEFLQGITEAEYAKYQAAIDKYLTSDKFKTVLSTSFADNIIKQLHITKAN